MHLINPAYFIDPFSIKSLLFPLILHPRGETRGVQGCKLRSQFWDFGLIGMKTTIILFSFLTKILIALSILKSNIAPALCT